jgi:endonuclease/exonuclease/phosphatase family metal-dependent hydrolase
MPTSALESVLRVAPRLRLRAAAAALAVLAGLALPATPAAALKVVTWNVIGFTGADSVTRNPNLRTVVAALDPDVIMLQELMTSAGRDYFLNQVLNAVQPGQWAATSYFSSCESAVFYKPAKVTLTFSGGAIPTSGPRDVLGVRLRVAGYASKLAEFRLYSVHFKAGNDAANSDIRQLECADLRNNMNLAPTTVTPNYMVGGDTNFYGDWEGGYQRLTESQADNDGRCFDPVYLPGTWNQYAYRIHHSQSTCSSGCPGGWSTGGLDDRLDFFLTSASLQDGEGLDLVPGTAFPYGNDGQHYNASVNGGGVNYAVGLTVANALFYSSDHLPAVVVLQIPARVLAASRLDFGSVLVGATAELPLTVANGAAAPADELDYSFTAPAGFGAPAGSFTAAAGAAGGIHAISMATATVGLKADTLRVSCDDPDSTAKAVLLAGTVLAHAVSSLDSAAVVTGAVVDLGEHAAGGFADAPVRLHNAGWSALQAKLEVTDGVVTGGDGRFSIVGGFVPVELAGVGHTYAVRFDADGATPDSTYEATLVFTSLDEDLPGAAPAADLTVTLRARATGGGVDVPPVLPGRTVFHAPSPNPARGAVTLRFDLGRDADVVLELFDLSGRRVATVLEGHRPAGRYALRMDAPADRDGRSRAGLYFLRFSAGDYARTRRLALVP